MERDTLSTMSLTSSQLKDIGTQLRAIARLLDSDTRALAEPVSPHVTAVPDHVTEYLSTRLVAQPGAEVTNRTLHADYVTWCGARGHEPTSSRQLVRQVKGPRRRSNSTTKLLGWRLR